MNRRAFNRTMLASAIAAASALPSRAQAPFSINAARLRSSLEALARFGATPEGGVTRVAWTQPEIEARRWLIEEVLPAAGLSVRVDHAGSIYARREGRDRSLPPILFGSHIDTVTGGGRFDGALGVMCAVEVMRTLHDKRLTTRHPLELVIWSDEEGERFGRGLFGSRAVLGTIDPREFDDRDDQGISLRDALRKVGGDVDRLAEAVRKKGDIAAYLELHIEQGGVLEKAGIPIGVVEGIVGIVRWQVRISGMANHAGTTPMPGRMDALVAASKLVLAVQEETVREPGRQVGTVGKLTVLPNAPNVIPGQVDLVIELRDLSMDRSKSVFERIEARAKRLSVDGIQIGMQMTSSLEPALATSWVQDIIEREGAAAGLKSMRMPSGAGHDAQSIARIAPMGMIFVPSVGAVSHSPKEFTRWDDCASGCEVLYRAVLTADSR